MLVTANTPEFDREARLLEESNASGLIYRLLNGSDSFEDTVRVTTQMAEAALNASLQHHRVILEQAFGDTVKSSIHDSWVWVS